MGDVGVPCESLQRRDNGVATKGNRESRQSGRGNPGSGKLRHEGFQIVNTPGHDIRQNLVADRDLGGLLEPRWCPSAGNLRWRRRQLLSSRLDIRLERQLEMYRQAGIRGEIHGENQARIFKAAHGRVAADTGGVTHVVEPDVTKRDCILRHLRLQYLPPLQTLDAARLKRVVKVAPDLDGSFEFRRS